jgi:hypothetical protein
MNQELMVNDESMKINNKSRSASEIESPEKFRIKTTFHLQHNRIVISLRNI